MKQEEALKSKYGINDGLKVPDGYFLDLQKEIMGKLGPMPKSAPVIVPSRWQRVKPYVYLAAMFCGIWLMMKVFHTATQPMSMSLDNPPEALVELLDNGYDYEPYNVYSPDYDIDDEELIMSYDNIEEFEEDFGYTLKPEYSTLTFPPVNTRNS